MRVKAVCSVLVFGCVLCVPSVKNGSLAVARVSGGSPRVRVDRRSLDGFIYLYGLCLIRGRRITSGSAGAAFPPSISLFSPENSIFYRGALSNPLEGICTLMSASPPTRDPGCAVGLGLGLARLRVGILGLGLRLWGVGVWVSSHSVLSTRAPLRPPPCAARAPGV